MDELRNTRERPRSPACERNRKPILEVLRPRLPAGGTVLELGAGTGQHAAYFAGHLPRLRWLASDRVENHPGIRAWIEHAGLPNLAGPLALDVTSEEWPVNQVDAVFSANTAHIMSWPAVKAMFAGAGRILEPGAPFLLYGPFHYHGEPTSKSNARFDEWLKDEDPGMGIRDIDDIQALAGRCGLALEEDIAMPANNRTLVFRRN